MRLRYVDDKPNVFVESYIPVDPYPNFEKYDFTTQRMYGAMTDEGHPVTQAHRRLDVIKADSAIAALLDVEVGDPLFLFQTVTLGDGVKLPPPPPIKRRAPAGPWVSGGRFSRGCVLAWGACLRAGRVATARSNPRPARRSGA